MTCSALRGCASIVSRMRPGAANGRWSLHDGELCVRDHGRGIPSDERPHVFDRFYRGAQARGKPGSGLGLAIVRQVLEQHDGNRQSRAGGGRRHVDTCASAHRDSRLHTGRYSPRAAPKRANRLA